MSSPSVRRYCSPEVLDGESPNEESLVWNIGMVLDEVTNGKLYFKN